MSAFFRMIDNENNIPKSSNFECVCVFRAVTIFISFVESLIPTGPGLLNTTTTTSLTSKTPTLKFSSRPYRLMLNSGVYANLCPLHVYCTTFVMLGLAARSLSR